MDFDEDILNSNLNFVDGLLNLDTDFLSEFSMEAMFEDLDEKECLFLDQVALFEDGCDFNGNGQTSLSPKKNKNKKSNCINSNVTNGSSQSSVKIKSKMKSTSKKKSSEIRPQKINVSSVKKRSAGISLLAKPKAKAVQQVSGKRISLSLFKSYFYIDHNYPSQLTYSRSESISSENTINITLDANLNSNREAEEQHSSISNANIDLKLYALETFGQQLDFDISLELDDDIDAIDEKDLVEDYFTNFLPYEYKTDGSETQFSSACSETDGSSREDEDSKSVIEMIKSDLKKSVSALVADNNSNDNTTNNLSDSSTNSTTFRGRQLTSSSVSSSRSSSVSSTCSSQSRVSSVSSSPTAVRARSSSRTSRSQSRSRMRSKSTDRRSRTRCESRNRASLHKSESIESVRRNPCKDRSYDRSDFNVSSNILESKWYLDRRKERVKEVEERRIVYVGNVPDGTTKTDLRYWFSKFGPITQVSLHFRDYGNNYAFVTFQSRGDAYEAIKRGNDDKRHPMFDLSFGGRRSFCKSQYQDLDRVEKCKDDVDDDEEEEDDDGDFDSLLKSVKCRFRH